MMNLNLDTLKEDIVRYLEENDFVIFHGAHVDLDPYPVKWNVKSYPDYQMFLHVARRSGANLIVVQSLEFERSDVELAYELLDEADLNFEEEDVFRKKLADYETYSGFTCRLRLAFSIGQQAYTYEAAASWFEEFEELCDELEDTSYYLEDEDEEDAEESNGLGFFSKN